MSNRWSQQEEERLAYLWQSIRRPDWKREFPSRTKEAISMHAFKKGLVRLSAPKEGEVRVTKACIICGEKFSARVGEARRYSSCASVSCRRLAHFGKHNPNWRGGVTKKRKSEMSTNEYRAWRKAVFERDDYTCQHCDKRGGNLEADHINPWTFYPKLRYMVKNGRTLCKPCHAKTFKVISLIREIGPDKILFGPEKLKTYLVDVDGTLCNEQCWTAEECLRATPKQEMINKINELYQTNFIVLYTARRDENIPATLEWARRNNIRFHAWSNQKTAGDVLIDDIAVRPEEIIKTIN